MSSPRPCLGHPSRTAAIAALRKDGLTTVEIAARIGDISRKTVRDLERAARCYHRKAKVAEPLRKIAVSAKTLASLSPHADRRGLHVNHLARLIVEMVARDNMIDAVLDDGVAR